MLLIGNLFLAWGKKKGGREEKMEDLIWDLSGSTKRGQEGMPPGKESLLNHKRFAIGRMPTAQKAIWRRNSDACLTALTD